MNTISKTLLGLFLLILPLPVLAAQEIPGEQPRLAVLDVRSDSLSLGQTRVVSDLFRTELFKTGLFQIVEQTRIDSLLGEEDRGLSQGVLQQISQQLTVDALLYMSLERFGEERLVLNVRLIAIPDQVLLYTDNFYMANADMIFESLMELTQSLQRYFRGEGTANPLEARLARWTQLGFSPEQGESLQLRGIEPDAYIGLRQYDIRITPEDFWAAVESGWDLAVIRQFLQSEIPYRTVVQAFEMGVLSLDHYRQSFRPAGFSFEEYLEAYGQNIISPEIYRDYRDGYRQNLLNVGVGGVADNFPIANASFSYPLAMVSWEHFWTPYQRSWFKASTDAGLYFLLVAPTPFVQANFYFGQYPYYAKFAVGGAAELLLGGHFAFYTRVGFELLERYEVSLLTTWTGTQPAVSYTDFETRRGEEGYQGLVFPYFGVVFTMKFFNLPF